MNTEWRKIAINAQNMCAETERGILIQMPHKSDYDGFKFWVSKKLLCNGRHSYEYLLSVNDGMKFKLFKNGSGQYNRFKTIAEQEVSADTLAEAFGGYAVEVRKTYHAEADFDREEIIRHTPEPLAPVQDAQADQTLVR